MYAEVPCAAEEEDSCSHVGFPEVCREGPCFLGASVAGDGPVLYMTERTDGVLAEVMCAHVSGLASNKQLQGLGLQKSVEHKFFTNIQDKIISTAPFLPCRPGVPRRAAATRACLDLVPRNRLRRHCAAAWIRTLS